MQYVPMIGGEDHVTPSLSVPPGRAMLTQNYELDTIGRYRLIDGYEAFNGRPKPSEASYWYLEFDAGSLEISVGAILAGAGGASGEVIAVSVQSGDWAGSDAAGFVILINVTGAYVNNEVLSVGVNPVATADGTESVNGAPTDDLDTTFKLAAIEALRDDIAAVPGSGSVRGVWQYGGKIYAFRDNLLATAGVMHESSALGWVPVDLGAELAFTSGSTEIEEDDVITGDASGATATVKKVFLDSGTWAGGDAAGRLIIYDQVGDFEAENLDVGAVSNLASIADDSIATTLPPGGRYEFINHNFGGHAGTRRMYGCNGVGKAFEWDGSVFVPISTGMTTDTPEHIIAHKMHLFFSFPGGSLQHSAIGDPYTWTAVLGAGELGIGDEITGLLSMPDVLAVFGRNSTHLLYGTSSADWELKQHSDEAGAIEWTVQRIGSGVYLDDRGLTSLSATDAYGDFAANTLSKLVEPWLKTKTTSAIASVRVKDKNQYRLFFDDMRALTLTMDGDKVVGFTRQLYDKQISCICSTENTSGKEEIYFGASDGFVYQMDKGVTLNGEPIIGVIKLHFNHLKSPSIKKRIRKIALELVAPINTYISASIEFDYGETDSGEQAFALGSPGGVWDIDDWDEFVWEGKSVASAPIDVNGTGANFSLTIYHSGDWELQTTAVLDAELDLVLPRSGITGADPHTIQGYTVHYDERGIQR
jgi:hypothetical protein